MISDSLSTSAVSGLHYILTDTVRTWSDHQRTWHYVRLSAAQSEEVRILAQTHQSRQRGWGAVRVAAQIGAICWQTSIFPVFEDKHYALFLKADVRKRTGCVAGVSVTVVLQLLF